MLKSTVLLLLGIVAFFTAANASAACDILKNECGSTETVKISGKKFARAVAIASSSNGKQSITIIKDKCDIDDNGALVRPATPLLGTLTCELKVLTGGKSHSKMKKQCAIASWSAYDNNWAKKNGIGGTWGLKILKRPKKNTRQKMWHIKVWHSVGPKPSSAKQTKFQLYSVFLKVPSSYNLKTSSSANKIRDICFQ